MAGSGGDEPPLPASNGGEFLLSLLQKHQHQPQPQPPMISAQQLPARPSYMTPPQQQYLPNDPAVAAVGPTINFAPQWSSNGLDLPQPSWPQSVSPPFPQNFLGFPQNNWTATGNQQLLSEDFARLGFNSTDYAIQNLLQQRILLEQQQKLAFASFQNPSQFKPESIANMNSLDNLNYNYPNGFDRNVQFDPRSNPIPNINSVQHRNLENSREQERRIAQPSYMSAPPPGFSNSGRGGGHSKRDFDFHVDEGKVNNQESSNRRSSAEDAIMHHGLRVGLTGQLDHPGPPSGSNLHSVSASEIEQSLLNFHREEMRREIEEHRDSSQLEDQSDNKDHKGDLSDKKHHRNGREKERSDNRGQRILSQRIRNIKWHMECRRDISRLNSPFLAIYESLIPPEEEKAKQKQLLSLLEKLVCKEWPNARLYLYGSCANSFGVSKSDIDVCVAIEEPDINKSEILLKLADILQSDNLQNVQALTRARVPIVKLMDPVTGISCDICINNLLAVVNTKLLRDYAQIDVRLRQLAFIIKHWAKSRGVNETYQGTLSSYAYVLMCIHFLQQRRPAILPCLQGMEKTYYVNVDDVECAYFDQVERLRDFGSNNRESIAQLVWAFFNYWAYGHDYATSVISVRTGSLISKMDKDWTRRIGNDRHLICIEDPFETSHDLGRVVDKYSIKVLREEFERAADIMQHDPNPCVTLFEPYVPS